ncbi:MAG: hypothetical protein WCI83_08435 [Thermoleophilia bacterium]
MLLATALALIVNRQVHGFQVATPYRGNSFGERWHHLNRALEALISSPSHFLAGLGLGQYGTFAQNAGDATPPTTTVQIMPVDIAVEFGVIGLAVIVALTLWALIRAWQQWGFPGTAAMVLALAAISFQSNWRTPWIAVVAGIAVATRVPRGDEAVVDRKPSGHVE